MYRHH